MKKNTIDKWLQKLQPKENESAVTYRRRAEKYTKKIYFKIKYSKCLKPAFINRLNQLAHRTTFDKDLKAEILQNSIVFLLKASQAFQNTYSESKRSQK